MWLKSISLKLSLITSLMFIQSFCFALSVTDNSGYVATDTKIFSTSKMSKKSDINSSDVLYKYQDYTMSVKNMDSAQTKFVFTNKTRNLGFYTYSADVSDFGDAFIFSSKKQSSGNYVLFETLTEYSVCVTLLKLENNQIVFIGNYSFDQNKYLKYPVDDDRANKNPPMKYTLSKNKNELVLMLGTSIKSNNISFRDK